MADIVEEALRDYVLDDTDVTDIVSTRVYWGIAPEKTAVPYIAFITIADTFEPISFANINTGVATMQWTCVSKNSMSQAKDLCVKLKNRIRWLQGTTEGILFEILTISSMRQMIDPVTKFPKCLLDIKVEYVE